MYRNRVYCWPYAMLMTVVCSVLPFYSMTSNNNDTNCELAGFGINLYPLKFEPNDFLSSLGTGDMVVQLHAATVSMMLLTTLVVNQCKHDHVTFWSVLPIVAYAFHPSHAQLFADSCAASYTSAMFLCCAGTLIYCREILYICSSLSFLNFNWATSSIASLVRLFLFVLFISLACEINMALWVVPFILLLCHCSISIDSNSSWKWFRWCSLGCALLALCLPIGFRIYDICVYGYSTYSAVNNFSSLHEGPSDTLVDNIVHNFMFILCSIFFDVMRLVVPSVLPVTDRVLSHVYTGFDSEIWLTHNLSTYHLLIIAVSSTLCVLLVLWTVWVVLGVVSSLYVLKPLTFICSLNHAYSPSASRTERIDKVICSNMEGTSRIVLVLTSCIILYFWHHFVLIHLGFVHIQTAVVSYMPGALLAVYLSK